MTNIWNYRPELADIRNDRAALIDLDVEATDGGIGKIVEESLETDRSRLVVDTGFWIFGTKRLIPAGVVNRVDLEEGKVYIDMTKDEVKASPEYIPPELYDPNYDSQAHIDYYRSWPWM